LDVTRCGVRQAGLSDLPEYRGARTPVLAISWGCVPIEMACESDPAAIGSGYPLDAAIPVFGTF